MSLEGIGQPYLSSGGGPFGTFVRAGGALLFGDMLGERRIGAAVQIGNRCAMRRLCFGSSTRNGAGTGACSPSSSRAWCAIGAPKPIEHDGQAALLKQADYLQRTQLRAAAVVAYPFSRGLRVEFTGGVRYASYHRDLRIADLLARDRARCCPAIKSNRAGGLPTTVAEVTAALVHDTTVFGPTGPLLGSRYRFEVAPARGSCRTPA